MVNELLNSNEYGLRFCAAIRGTQKHFLFLLILLAGLAAVPAHAQQERELFDATLKSDLARLRDLTDNKCVNVNLNLTPSGARRYTALMASVLRWSFYNIDPPNPEVVQFLLERGADPNVMNGNKTLIALVQNNLAASKYFHNDAVRLRKPDIEPGMTRTFSQWIDANQQVLTLLQQYRSGAQQFKPAPCTAAITKKDDGVMPLPASSSKPSATRPRSVLGTAEEKPPPGKSNNSRVRGDAINPGSAAATGVASTASLTAFGKLLAEADRLADQKRWNEAIETYGAALKVNPGSAEANIKLANAFMSTGQWKEAVAAYKEGIRVEPRNADAYYALGSAYNQMRQHGDAFGPLVRAVQLDPKFAEAHYEIGNAYLGLDSFAKALPFLKTSIRLQPNFAEGYYGLGLAYLGLGNKVEAMAQSEKLKKLDPALAQKLDAAISR